MQILLPDLPGAHFLIVGVRRGSRVPARVRCGGLLAAHQDFFTRPPSPIVPLARSGLAAVGRPTRRSHGPSGRFAPSPDRSSARRAGSDSSAPAARGLRSLRSAVFLRPLAVGGACSSRLKTRRSSCHPPRGSLVRCFPPAGPAEAQWATDAPSPPLPRSPQLMIPSKRKTLRFHAASAPLTGASSGVGCAL